MTPLENKKPQVSARQPAILFHIASNLWLFGIVLMGYAFVDRGGPAGVIILGLGLAAVVAFPVMLAELERGAQSDVQGERDFPPIITIIMGTIGVVAVFRYWPSLG